MPNAISVNGKTLFFFERLSVNFAAAFDVNRMQARFFYFATNVKNLHWKKIRRFAAIFIVKCIRKNSQKCYQKEFSEMLSEFV